MLLNKENIKKYGELNNEELKEYKLRLSLDHHKFNNTNESVSIDQITSLVNDMNIYNIVQRIYNKKDMYQLSEIRYNVKKTRLSYDYNNTLYIQGNNYKEIKFKPEKTDITIFINKNNWIDIFIKQIENNIEIEYHIILN